jgi:hypothetical protein
VGNQLVKTQRKDAKAQSYQAPLCAFASLRLDVCFQVQRSNLTANEKSVKSA